jgi:diguanylate cyclase (GGDEF)-like protein
VLWTLPARVRSLVLPVELLALALLCLDAQRHVVTRPTLALALALAAVGVVHTEIVIAVERLRRRVAGTRHHDLSSVWAFAAALSVPPLLAGLVVLVISTHQWLRAWRPLGVPAYRQIYGTATVVLACQAAWAVLLGLGGQPIGLLPRAHGVLASGSAVLAFLAVNIGLTAAMLGLVGARSADPPERPAGHLDGALVELATLCLGALAAEALVTDPWQVTLVLAPLLVLHRAVLVRQLEQVANTDSKTGLLTDSAWRLRAAKELRRAERGRTGAAVLILDLDRFKAVNDDHGHLAGDAVLGAVASALRAEVREHDLVGRFGGEEFVVLLPALGREHGRDGGEELRLVAERIRRRISALSVVVSTPTGMLTIAGLSVSVGGAAYPEHGLGLDGVLEAADGALYAAKRDGRNVVRIAERAPAGTPPR